MIKRREFMKGAGLVAAGSLWPLAAFAGDMPSDNDHPNWRDFAIPPNPFNSNHNYFIYGGGEPIRGLRVIVHIDSDLVVPNGMSMQLNGNSPIDANCVWQQYVTGFDPKWDTLEIGWSIENFPSKEFRWHLHETIGFPCGVDDPTQTTCKGNLFNYPPELTRTPFATYTGPSTTVPAGFKIKYELLDESDGNIVGAKYTVLDNHGNETTSGEQHIHTFDFAGTDKKVGPKAVAPILAFQMNLVGLNGGAPTTATSGSGRITYESSTPLTPQGDLSALASVFQGGGTTETSNVVYTELDSKAKNKIVQRWSVPST